MNSYFIRGKERNLLIDTGSRKKECQEALEEGLRQLGSHRERRDVLITHFHTDHAGLADLAADIHGKVYMNQADAVYDRRADDEKLNQETVLRFRSEDFDEVHMKRLFARASENMTVSEIENRLYTLQPHERIVYGNYSLENISIPGHAPGNMVLWAEKQGIMFCGDHILFDISPNITPYTDVADSLGDYMNSLREAAKHPVKLALPGHRKSGDYQERITQLLAHHERRLIQARQIVAATRSWASSHLIRW